MTELSRSVHGWGRMVLWLVLGLMVAAALYAALQGIRNWTVIGV